MLRVAESISVVYCVSLMPEISVTFNNFIYLLMAAKFGLPELPSKIKNLIVSLSSRMNKIKIKGQLSKLTLEI